MTDFERLLAEHRGAVTRYVRFHIASEMDAEDVLQETFLAAFQKFAQLRSVDSFKPWLLGIARNKCADYYRASGRGNVPAAYFGGVYDHGHVRDAVQETLLRIPERDRALLCDCYYRELEIRELAQKWQIPCGTVKSRLHTARARFAAAYPYPPKQTEGAKTTMKFPKQIPNYTIEWLDEAPFSVRSEELPGWLIVPREGEKLSWALYYAENGQLSEYTDLEVVGRAEVHGVSGVEIRAIQYGAEDYFRTGCVDKMERRFVAQLTDTHCRFLAESHVENGVRKCYTFLDGDSFADNWGYGRDNCGSTVALRQAGILHRAGTEITGPEQPENPDIVGRCRVTIRGRVYDTVCAMDVMTFSDSVLSESYLDANGRTVLWRRFNRDDWAIEHFGGTKWSERLLQNERLTVNGQTFVHWYDCITSYIF